MEQRKQARGRHQHFIGSWARLNCEEMPVIPAWIVRSNLEDPRRTPYLLVWKDDRHGGEIREAVRLTCHVDPYPRSRKRVYHSRQSSVKHAVNAAHQGTKLARRGVLNANSRQ